MVYDHNIKKVKIKKKSIWHIYNFERNNNNVRIAVRRERENEMRSNEVKIIFQINQRQFLSPTIECMNVKSSFTCVCALSRIINHFQRKRNQGFFCVGSRTPLSTRYKTKNRLFLFFFGGEVFFSSIRLQWQTKWQNESTQFRDGVILWGWSIDGKQSSN